MSLLMTTTSGRPDPVCSVVFSLVSRSGVGISLICTSGNCFWMAKDAFGTEPGAYQMVSARPDAEPVPPPQAARLSAVTVAAGEVAIARRRFVFQFHIELTFLQCRP